MPLRQKPRGNLGTRPSDRPNGLIETRGRDHAVVTYNSTSTRTLCTIRIVHALLACRNKITRLPARYFIQLAEFLL